MGYSDQKFYSRPLQLWGQAVDFGLSVATTVAVTDAVTQLPKFIRKSQVNAIRLRCTTIPNADATALTVSVLNGTSTMATAVITTATADQHIDATVVTTNDVNVFAADAQPTISITGTATATDDSMGDFDIWAEVQEEYA
jgi:hypothetical protein